MELQNWLKAERGRAKKLATALGVSSATISEWASKAKPVPLERCMPIETFTCGAVTRPDLFPAWRSHWPELSDLRSHAGPDAVVAGG